MPPEAIAALEKGNKIEAISIVRTRYGLDLAKSKEVIESYLGTNAALRESLNTRSSEGNRVGCLVLISLIALGLFIYWQVALR